MIIQGSADRALKANAVMQLLSRLSSYDQTVRWLPRRGHILLETSYLDDYVVSVIGGWLWEHTTREPVYRSAQSIRDEMAGQLGLD